ncbi:MAG: heme exporter protein CcmB [Myxococcota bacterium]
MNPSFLRQFRAIIGKDLRREWRTREILTTTISFAVLLMVVFTFAFYRDQETVAFVFPGILWISVVFSGTLAINRTFAQENESGCLRALALAPRTDVSLYLAKLVVNLLFMFAFELVLVPVLAIAFNVDILTHIGWHALAIVAGTIGFAALGTLVSAMLVHSRLRDVLLPIVLYPLCVPLLIAGVKSTSMLMGEPDLEGVWDWSRIVLAIDGVFVIGSALLFRWVLSAIE